MEASWQGGSEPGRDSGLRDSDSGQERREGALFFQPAATVALPLLTDPPLVAACSPRLGINSVPYSPPGLAAGYTAAVLHRAGAYSGSDLPGPVGEKVFPWLNRNIVDSFGIMDSVATLGYNLNDLETAAGRRGAPGYTPHCRASTANIW